MAWVILLAAAALEIVWAVCLKYTDGFSRPLISTVTVAAMIASLYLLALAVRSLPLGTAYAAWVGIGTVGTAILGMLLFGESHDPARLFFIGLLVISVLGLQITAAR